MKRGTFRIYLNDSLLKEILIRHVSPASLNSLAYYLSFKLENNKIILTQEYYHEETKKWLFDKEIDLSKFGWSESVYNEQPSLEGIVTKFTDDKKILNYKYKT